MNRRLLMNPKKRAIALLTTTLLLAGGAIAISPDTHLASAQSFPNPEASLNFPPDSDRGAPRRTVGTGVRGEGCRSERFTTPLTALTPTNNIVKTVAGNPSIYVYVPSYEQKVAFFHIIDPKTEEIIYETEISLSNLPGVIELHVPETVQLEANITYEWGFYVECDPDNPAADEGIEGWIERAELTPKQESDIQQVAENSLEQAQLYARAGVWHETLAIVARMRDTDSRLWVELLESVDLAPEIVESSIIQPTVISDRE